MDFEQVEKDLKKITDSAEKLPERYREESFRTMMKLYCNEKLIEMELERRKKIDKDATKDGAN